MRQKVFTFNAFKVSNQEITVFVLLNDEFNVEIKFWFCREDEYHDFYDKTIEIYDEVLGSGIIADMSEKTIQKYINSIID